MAAIVQSAFGFIFGGTSTTLSFSANVTPGNFLIIAIIWGTGTGLTYTVSDAGGDTITHVAAADSLSTGNLDQKIFYAQNSVGGFKNVSVSIPTSQSGIFVYAYEVSGILKVGNPVDATAVLNNGISTSPTSNGPSITTTTANDFVFVFDQKLNMSAVASPYTLLPNPGGNQPGVYYQPAGTLTGSVPVFSTTAAIAHSASAVAFLPQPPPPPQLLPFPWMETTGNMQDMTGGMRN